MTTAATNERVVQKEQQQHSQQKELKYLEFFSGIGGWGYALEQACSRITQSEALWGTQRISFRLKRLCAFDNSEVSNSVLCYNTKLQNDDDMKVVNEVKYQNQAVGHQTTPKKRQKTKRNKMPRNEDDDDLVNRVKTVSIETLTPKQISQYDADIWAMSPPCQPFTRNNIVMTDDSDPRSKSFLHLCRLLGDMEYSRLPSLILLENVVGFESSNSCHFFEKTLRSKGYSLGFFHLSPTQVGIPNDRPRCYCAATLKKRHNYDENNNETTRTKKEATMSAVRREDLQAFFGTNAEEFCDGVNESSPLALLQPHLQIHTSIKPLDVLPINDAGLSSAKLTNILLPPISQFLDNTINESVKTNLLIPWNVLSKTSSWCFDVVTPEDRRSSCFTHSYGRFMRGTGSVLYTGNNDSWKQKIKLVLPEERRFQQHWWRDDDEITAGNDDNGAEKKETQLRYFSGTEIARLLGFPVDYDDNTVSFSFSSSNKTNVARFAFPPELTLKQQWKLLGNSLNVCVAAKIAELGLRLIL